MAVSVRCIISVRACVLCVCAPCDSLDELEIHNIGLYSKPRPKTVIHSPLFSSVVGRHGCPRRDNSIKMSGVQASAVIIM